jgi:hypothetical protein
MRDDQPGARLPAAVGAKAICAVQLSSSPRLARVEQVSVSRSGDTLYVQPAARSVTGRARRSRLGVLSPVERS